MNELMIEDLPVTRGEIEAARMKLFHAFERLTEVNPESALYVADLVVFVAESAKTEAEAIPLCGAGASV